MSQGPTLPSTRFAGQAQHLVLQNGGFTCLWVLRHCRLLSGGHFAATARETRKAEQCLLQSWWSNPPPDLPWNPNNFSPQKQCLKSVKIVECEGWILHYFHKSSSWGRGRDPIGQEHRTGMLLIISEFCLLHTLHHLVVWSNTYCRHTTC